MASREVASAVLRLAMVCNDQPSRQALRIIDDALTAAEEERDRLREALEDFVRASSRITARVRLRYAADHGIAKAVGQFERLYNAQVNAELLLRAALQEAGDDERNR